MKIGKHRVMTMSRVNEIAARGTKVTPAGPVIYHGLRKYRPVHVHYQWRSSPVRVWVALGPWVSAEAENNMVGRKVRHVCDDECRSNGCSARFSR